jgi:hypothetical protein
MTMNATLGWVLPTERESDNPLPETAIKESIVSLKVAGAPDFTEMDRVPAPGNSHLIPDLADGSYAFQIVIVDNAGRESAPAEAPFLVDDSPPKPATGLTVDLS